MELYLAIDPKDLPSAQQKGACVRNGRIFFYERTHIKQMRQLIIHMLCTLATGKIEAPAYILAIEYIYLPKSLLKGDYGKPKTTGPDLDNITKLMLDAITDSHIAWFDDRAVSTIVQRKRFANPDLNEQACVFIRIEEDLCQ